MKQIHEDRGHMRTETDLPARVALHVVLMFAPNYALEIARELFRSPLAVRHRGELTILLGRLGGDPVETGILLVLAASDAHRHTPNSLAQTLRVRRSEVDTVLESMAFAGRLEYRRDWRRDAELALQLSGHGRRLAERLLIEFARSFQRLAATFAPESGQALDGLTDTIRRSLTERLESQK